MDIVIPIFNPSHHRLSNLKFILDEMSAQNIQNVYVCEQNTNTKDVKNLINSYSFVNYHSIDIESDKFNKSKLVNSSFNITTSDLVWLLDGDVYLNYRYVQLHTPNYVDFIRPFDKIVILDEVESKILKETSRIKLTDRQYDSYQGYGKYSMIIRRTLFNSIGGFDERYKGWGFQDLDFVKKIPNDAKKGHTDNVGFHLHHDRQSLEDYSDNKNLYNEVKERVRVKKKPRTPEIHINKKEEDYYEPIEVTDKPISVPKVLPKPKKEPIIYADKPTGDKIVWNRPSHIYINKSKKGKSLATEVSSWGNVFMRDISKPTSISRTMRGTSQREYNYKSNLLYFLEFIIKIYDELTVTSVVLYINDTIDREIKAEKLSILKKFNRGKVELNANIGVTHLQYSPDFAVGGKIILLREKCIYEQLLSNMKEKTKKEQNKFIGNIPDYFLEI